MITNLKEELFMSDIKKEKDYVLLSFRNKIGGMHAFDTEQEALDWAEANDYEPEEIKITPMKGQYAYKSTLWNTEKQAQAIRNIVTIYNKSFPEEQLYAGEAYLIAKFLMAGDFTESIVEDVVTAFEED